MNHLMKPLAFLAVASLTGNVHAEGISANEYAFLQETTRCAFISNLMTPSKATTERSQKIFKIALDTFKHDSAALQGYAYKPTPDELATDFAIHYQQQSLDINDEMFRAIHQQGLPAEPKSWFKVAAQYWLSQGCDSLIQGN